VESGIWRCPLTKKGSLFLAKKIKATCSTIRSSAPPSTVGVTARSKPDMKMAKTASSIGIKITDIFSSIKI
jgi:hypothetical protein